MDEMAEGFGGMRVKDNQLHFSPKIPKEWEGYSFKINFRNQIVTVSVIKRILLSLLMETTH
jgi:maltose phosphorylase